MSGSPYSPLPHIRKPPRAQATHANVAALDHDSIFRFCSGGSLLFDNCSVWVAAPRAEAAPRLVFSYPADTRPSTGTTEHIFPALASLASRTRPFFQLAAVRPEKGFRTIYSLTFHVRAAFACRAWAEGGDAELAVPARSLVVVSIESKFVHPQVFHCLLHQVYNDLTASRVAGGGFSLSYALEAEVEKLANGECRLGPQFPFDISPGAEVARFHHFLFASFPVPKILTILTSLLASQHALVTSVKTTRIGLGCFALLSLLFPLKWPGVFVPLLPESMTDVLQAPFPFVIGIPFLWFAEPGRVMDVTMVVNLDVATVIKSSDQLFTVSPAYSVLINEIARRMDAEAAFYRKKKVFPAARIQRLLWKFIVGMLAITAGFTQPDPELTLETLAAALLRARDAPAGDAGSLQAALVESQVVCDFTDGLSKLVHRPAFSAVFSEMGDIMLAVQSASPSVSQ
jgi:hypothetical protein